jgi:Spy/CpxP family protein refolding chaperone
MRRWDLRELCAVCAASVALWSGGPGLPRAGAGEPDAAPPAAEGARAEQPQEGRRHGRRGPPALEAVLERHAARLGLDDATRERIRDIAEQGRAEGEPLREELRAQHQRMRELLSQDLPDEAAVMRQAEQLGEVETRLHQHRLRTMLRIRALLTSEQRQELVRIREERKQRRRAWWGSGGNAPAQAPGEPSAQPAPEPDAP